MSKVWKVITSIPKFICYALIYLYRIILRPIFPSHCGYTPSCSEYMLQSIREWGVIKGISLGTKRLLRCNPRHKCGFDPVPINPKGEHKWVF
ncbi:MAG: membrane protein insertion efficiency factor YidD [Clostridia bacterium]|nr:membrane protein insertion efficiency factor YidD [Clostridia bacterium]